MKNAKEAKDGKEVKDSADSKTAGTAGSAGKTEQREGCQPIYGMKQVCEISGLSYDTLKYYCNEGLVPYVKRDKNGHRIFDQNDVNWVVSLAALRDCDMSMDELHRYMELVKFEGNNLEQRISMLKGKRKDLENEIARIQRAMGYIDERVQFYQDVLSGKHDYTDTINTKTFDFSGNQEDPETDNS